MARPHPETKPASQAYRLGLSHSANATAEPIPRYALVLPTLLYSLGWLEGKRQIQQQEQLLRNEATCNSTEQKSKDSPVKASKESRSTSRTSGQNPATR